MTLQQLARGINGAWRGAKSANTERTAWGYAREIMGAIYILSGWIIGLALLVTIAREVFYDPSKVLILGLGLTALGLLYALPFVLPFLLPVALLVLLVLAVIAAFWAGPVIGLLVCILLAVLAVLACILNQ